MEPNRSISSDDYAADISSIRQAQVRIEPFAHKTPVLTSETLDSIARRKLYFKCECFQKGGAFKFRGACNAIYSLHDDQAAKGVVTHSSGNHAAALALAAKLRGIPAYIVIPKNAPKCKVENVKRYGGQVIWSEPSMQSREDTANKVLQDTGAVLIHPYNDGRIISGQGTISLELLEQVSGIDTLIVPISGGGLISGVALAAKAINPTIRIFAAEPMGADDAFQSKINGRITKLSEVNTIADGLRAFLGDLTWCSLEQVCYEVTRDSSTEGSHFSHLDGELSCNCTSENDFPRPIVRDFVDDVIIVDDEEIIQAMRLCYEILKIAVEPSGAIGLAAVLSDTFRKNRAYSECNHIGIVISGGNVDLAEGLLEATSLPPRATEYWGIVLLRDCKFLPPIKVIWSEPSMQSREHTANKVLQDTSDVLSPSANDGHIIREAQVRIRPFVQQTPVFTSHTLDSIAGRKLYFKCECFQKGGAFKFRGACNAVFSLDDDQATKGVVTHSSGNHAAALSLAAKLRGIPAYIVIPKNAPKCKIANVKRYGGQVIFSEPSMQSREDTANKVLQDTGAVLIPSSNDGRIISGQGTISLEFLEQASEIDTLIVPISGGGMISGVALAAKAINPAVRILAAEPMGANDAFQSKSNGRITKLSQVNTIADGLRAFLGDLTWPIVRDLVDDIIVVDDKEIIQAMKLCYEILKIAVEPSGAIGLAAVLSDTFRKNPAYSECNHIGIVISGGNVDLGVLWNSFDK